MARCRLLIVVFAFILASAVAIAAHERSARTSEILVYRQLDSYGYDDLADDDCEDSGDDDCDEEDDCEEDDDDDSAEDDCDEDEGMTVSFPGSLSSTVTVQVSGKPKLSVPTTASLTVTSSSLPAKPALSSFSSALISFKINTGTTTLPAASHDHGGPFSFSGAEASHSSPPAAAASTSFDVSLLTASVTLKSTSSIESRLPSQRPEAATSSGVRANVPVWGIVAGIVQFIYYLLVLGIL